MFQKHNTVIASNFVEKTLAEGKWPFQRSTCNYCNILISCCGSFFLFEVFYGRIRNWGLEVSGLCWKNQKMVNWSLWTLIEESENGKCSSVISCGELDTAARGQRRVRELAGEINAIRNKVKEIRQNDAIGLHALHNDDLYDRMIYCNWSLRIQQIS